MLSPIDTAGTRHSAMCSRCLRSSSVIEGDRATAERELAEAGWELRINGQTWCLECSRDARTPLGAPTQRGVVKRRRGR